LTCTAPAPNYRLWLDRISERFGSAPLAAFADARMRGDIIDWRDTWSAQPRTADKASVMLATLLGWVVERGRLPVNVAAAIPQLHQADKADEVWERRHMRAMVNAPAHLRHALVLAAFTGLRLGDLVRLEWANVGSKAIIVTTRKRKGRAVIPVTPTLRRLLDKLAAHQAQLVKELELESAPTTVLVNSRAAAWTESGLGSVFQKSKPKGFDRRIHDLRGTYATWLATKGLTNEEIARILGWTAKRVDEIRARYVNEERVVISLLERMSA
jgi:integrase